MKNRKSSCLTMEYQREQHFSATMSSSWILSSVSSSRLGILTKLATIFLFCTLAVESFVLDGSPASFAQFPRWNPRLNGTLSIQFRTREPNGLLLYTDDSGAFDFFEVKLVEGVARLRFNLGGGTAVLAAGRNLHDSQWHTLQISRNAEETIFTVDEETQRRLTPGPDYYFGNLTTLSAVFIGGIPSWYGTKLDLLALPSAYFEPRFRGEVKNLTFASDDSVHRMQEMQEAEGIRSVTVTPPTSLYSATPSSEGYTLDSSSFSSSLSINGHKSEDDHCDRDDPCQNGGRCISTDAGAICDCRTTDYEGDHCEQKRPPSEATFSGNEYLEFEVRGRGGEPLISWSDRVSLHFRTRHSVGLLILLISAPTDGDSGDYLQISLKGGALVVSTRLGASGSRIERTVRPSRIRFDDNQWHRVVVHRKVREITRATGFCHLSVTVDGVHTERGSTAGAFSTLASGVVYVGGVDPHLPSVLPPTSTVRSNFVGCVKKAELMADSVSLDLIQLAKSQSALLRHHGEVQFFCQEAEASDPITFTTREAFLALSTWQGSRTGTITFKFRTNEGTGLLMYNGGAPSAQGSSSGDVFALELLDGHVYLILGLGSGIAKVKATSKRCDDGAWHSLTLRRTGRSGRIAVDEAAYDFTTPGSASQLDLEGPLYIGGLATPEQSTTVPPELWSAKLRYGFVGCMRSLVINSRAIDMAAHAREQDTGSLRPSCHASTSPQCDSQPCLNGGVCSEGWNRFVCDCTRTSFTGPVCAKDASTLSFDGSQFLRISIAEGSRTQAEDVHLRFRSPRPGGLLLATTSDKSVTFLAIGLEAGKLKVVLNLGNKNKIIHFGQSLNDDAWHTVHLRRRGHKMDLHVDAESKSYDLGAVDSVTMDIQVLHLGAVHPENQKPVKGFPNFVGHMQHLVFNRKHYLDMAHSGQIPNMKVTAKFGKKDHIVHHPVTFKSKYTFLGLPQLRAYSGLNLYLQFKTLEPNGLILYNGGKGQDFVALELVNGHLHYVFNLGDGPRGVRSNTRNTLNDNRWHAVTIGRPSTYQHTLMVDDMVTKVNSPGPNTHLDLHGLLYVGGVRRPMYNSLPRLVHSRHGFQGCLASLDLNGETGDILKEALIPSTLVSKGCAGPVTKCSHSACANHGVCIQMLNSYTCDCDMSSFSGPLCADESISYEFGPGTGLITFTYPPDKRPDTKTDLVALGFITMTDNGVLVRIDSGTSNDYLELEIVDGNVLAVYNMGTEDHPIGEHSVRVNDGHYHVVRFTRSGANSTIQIDEHNVRAKQPTGHQLTVFNSHATVQVGGKRSALGKAIERPFQGIISGLVFNGDRILDMAAEDDPRVKVEGDVELLMSLPLGLQQRSVPSHYDNQRMMQSGASPTYEGDDLVYSGGGGGGSGCWDDEDDCGEIEPTSGDDLITPVYIPPTPKPQPRTTPGPSSSASIPGRSILPSGASRGVDDTICDDEEDCVDGSGLGEIGVADRSPRPTSPGGIPQPPTSHHDEETAVGPAPPRQPASPPPQPAQLYPTTMGTTTALVVTTPQIRQYWPETIVTVASHGGNIYRKPPHEDEYPRAPPPPPIHPATPRSPSISTSRSPPPVYGVPIPEMPVTGRDRGFKPPPRAKSSSAADNTAMVIGIVAGVLIVIVIVALVVYRVRSWTGYSKADDEGGLKRPPYHAAPNAAPHYQQAPPAAAANGAIKGGADPAKLMKQPKKKDVKDLKEWYV